MEIILFVAGLILGTTGLYLWLWPKITYYKEQIKSKEEHFQKEFENQKQYYEKTLKDKEEGVANLKLVFENTAQKILQNKAEHYQKESEKSLGHILNPLKEKISTFEKMVQSHYETAGKERHSLREEIKRITDASKNLTQALKSDVKAQGDWGEVVLKRLLELAGLREGGEFTVQGKGMGLKSEEGKILKPDVIVHLPDKKNIIIDSKVSLTHYHNYIEATEEEDKQNHLKQLKNSFQNHIKDLSEKDYSRAMLSNSSSKSLNSPDFVLMFVPLEGALSLTIQEDPKLFEQAWEKSIVIVSPITLYATLKTIGALWSMDKYNKNAQEIARQSGALYDKFAGFMESMQSIGKGLDNTQSNYDKALRQLKTGKGSLISRAEKIKGLGARTSKEIPVETEEDSEDS